MSTPATEKSGLQIRPLRYADPVVRALETELQQEYVTRYGGPDETPLENGEFDPPRGLFLVGFVGAEPVASGGFRRHDDEVAEIKRMYVSHDHRGDGHARRLLAELEARATEAGYNRVVLMTGTAQAEAMALYESSGYVPADGFGPYDSDAESRFYGKDLRSS
jgi:GNAT superfamily N-acetyltransferase